MERLMIARKRVLVTGANGFIGKNLMVRLTESSRYSTVTFLRGDPIEALPSLVKKVDAVIHLAGENRPVDESAYQQVNYGLTSSLCDAIKNTIISSDRKIPLVFASSVQAQVDNPYGKSKRNAEEVVEELALSTGNPATIFRFPGVFGKWCKPDYNSVVATFCFRIPRGLPIQIRDPLAALKLVYVDDVIDALIEAADNTEGFNRAIVEPEYSITLGDLANQIELFTKSRQSLISERVGSGLLRALYATYISYLSHDKFCYSVTGHSDHRGIFVEMLKTQDSGQVSYFTAFPGVTRGGHYHHTKTEKFLVIKGIALFRFRNLVSDEVVQINTSGDSPKIVDTVPGWVHDITNVGSEEMIVMLWANENFNPIKTDTIPSKIL
jgi:UDP-2-acetamido-2,6-beta-L-arabino-hexul-4-ose reductase